MKHFVSLKENITRIEKNESRKERHQNCLKLPKRKINNETTCQKVFTQNQKNVQKGNKAKKGIKDYQFYTGTNEQVAEYEIEGYS